jgi:phenylpyruvate tautomerase PptA (4-oxalocrotonate tautomerase family)
LLKETNMPSVNIKITPDGVTPMVVIDEVGTDNRGIGGETVTERGRMTG